MAGRHRSLRPRQGNAGRAGREVAIGHIQLQILLLRVCADPRATRVECYVVEGVRPQEPEPIGAHAVSAVRELTVQYVIRGPEGSQARAARPRDGEVVGVEGRALNIDSIRSALFDLNAVEADPFRVLYLPPHPGLPDHPDIRELDVLAVVQFHGGIGLAGLNDEVVRVQTPAMVVEGAPAPEPVHRAAPEGEPGVGAAENARGPPLRIVDRGAVQIRSVYRCLGRSVGRAHRDLRVQCHRLPIVASVHQNGVAGLGDVYRLLDGSPEGIHVVSRRPTQGLKQQYQGRHSTCPVHHALLHRGPALTPRPLAPVHPGHQLVLGPPRPWRGALAPGGQDRPDPLISRPPPFGMLRSLQSPCAADRARRAVVSRRRAPASTR
jgi:hypothetical protein